MADDLTRALERRTLRTRQVAIATAAAVLAVAARHASRELEVTAVAAVAAVVTFAVALVVAHRDVRVRSIDPSGSPLALATINGLVGVKRFVLSLRAPTTVQIKPTMSGR